MLKKTTNFSLIFVLLFLFSCVNEPYIEPVKTPYSIVRVGNFSNLNNVSVTINNDREDPSIVVNRSIASNELSDYFELTSGNRTFTITWFNEATNTTDTIYSRPISIISYNQLTILFGGNYIDADNNSINFKSFSLGKVYLNDYIPPVDSSIVYFVNLVSSTTDTVSSAVSFSISMMDSMSTLVDTTEALDTYSLEGLVMENGSYTVLAESETGADSLEQDIASGMIYYIITSGTPDEIVFKTDFDSPLPPQDK